MGVTSSRQRIQFIYRAKYFDVGHRGHCVSGLPDNFLAALARDTRKFLADPGSIFSEFNASLRFAKVKTALCISTC